jgi:hypothetical protein
MKSGWWSGDGDEFHNLLLPRIVRDCRLVEIEYYFLQYLEPGSLLRFREFRLALSGSCRSTLRSRCHQRQPDGARELSVAAVERVPPGVVAVGRRSRSDGHSDGDQFFQNMLAKFRTPATGSQSVPSLFLAAGLGHRDHANHVLRALELPEMFQSHVTDLVTPHFADPPMSWCSHEPASASN